jgi:hypothetical protein
MGVYDEEMVYRLPTDEEWSIAFGVMVDKAISKGGHKVDMALECSSEDFRNSR